jgi:hypothetical protein
VRKRAGLEFSELVDDPEILEYLNQEFAELRSRIRRNEGQPHHRTTKPLVVTAGTALYDLPVDCWELLGIEATIGGLSRRVEPFMENERAALGSAILPTTYATPMYRYASRTQIEFLPSTLSFTATLKYVQGEPRLRLGQVPPDTIDGFNGYEIAGIYGAVATCREKEGLDPSFYAMQKERILKLIDANAAQRDAGSPERVTDVTGGLDYDIFSPYGFR